MSAKSLSAIAIISLVLALGALGYALWGTWTLRTELSRMMRAQERNTKEMMISLAHTEGQLGRVKEAVQAFDLNQWLATVKGPLVDGLKDQLIDVQRGVVREEVEKLTEALRQEQVERFQAVAKVVGEMKAGIAEQGAVMKRVNESLSLLGRNQGALSAQYGEAIGKEFLDLKQQSREIKAQLDQSSAPVSELRAQLDVVRKENRELREWLEQVIAAEEEFRGDVTERLDLFADSVTQQNAAAQEQIEASNKRWQGLFLTLRENHEAELQSVREAVSRLEEERALALEQLEKAEAERRRQEKARVERARETRETRGSRMSELIEFCSRRPESVLCRDLQVR